jgi:RimJ/RimL family protein N-acetyltransferase
MQPIHAEDLSELIAMARRRFDGFDDALASQPTKPSEWTSKQLLGHLIDSAINNYQRVIRLQIAEHHDADGVLRVPGYAQGQWVSCGDYAARSWADLVELWAAINRQLVHALRAFDGNASRQLISIGGQAPVPAAVAFDYVDHLRMHLADFPPTPAPAIRLLPATIEVGDLLIRLPQPSDADAVVAAVQDPEIPRWTTVPSDYGIDQANDWIAMANERFARGDHRRHYVIVQKGALVGSVGLVSARIDDQQGEVGYWLAPEARGNGIARRALTAVVTELLRAGYQRIDAEIIVGNEPSQRVLEAVGFIKEGRFRSVGAHGCGDSARRIDVDCFSLLPTDPAAIALLTIDE